MLRSSSTREPLWLTAEHPDGRTQVLLIDPGGSGETLPVFSFEEEADLVFSGSERRGETGG